MNKALELSIACPTGDLKAYENAVHAFPMVSAAEERDLATRYRSQGDLNAAWQLVTSHLRFVVKIARGYRGYGLPEADIIQEDNVGLMKAVKRFDPALGARLATFAMYHIKAEIHEFVLKNWRLVKVATTKAQRKLFYRLRSHKTDLNPVGTGESEAIAELLNVEPGEVLEMDTRLRSRDESFENPDAPNDASKHRYPEDYIADERYEPATAVENSQWKKVAYERLESAIRQLDERSRDVIRKRWCDEDKKTLQTLAQNYGVSVERIWQIEQSALNKVREQLADLGA